MLPTVVVVADYAGTLVLSDRTDVRARVTQQTGGQAGVAALGTAGSTTGPPVVVQNGGPTVGVDVANKPYAALQMTDRRWNFRLEYGPSLTLPDLELGVSPQFYQTGVDGIEWHSREVRLSLNETGSYGLLNSGYLFQPNQNSTAPGAAMPPPNQLGATPPANQLAPSAAQSITYVTTDTILRADVLTGTRSSFYTSAAYLVSGGINTPLLPETYGPRFEAGLNVGVGRRDQFVTQASAQASYFTSQQCIDSNTGQPENATCNPEVGIAQLTQGVRHQLERRTTFELDGGASVVRSRQTNRVFIPCFQVARPAIAAAGGGGGASRCAPGGKGIPAPDTPYTTSVNPAALAALTHVYRGHDNLTFRLDASYQPVVDTRSGFATDRIQVDVSLADSLNRIVRLTVTAAGAQTIPTDAPLAASLVRGDIELEVALTKRVQVSVGESTQYQSQNPYGAFFSAYGFLAVTVATQALRF
jgi:hypothetical protein